MTEGGETFARFVTDAVAKYGNRFEYWIDESDPARVYRGHCREHGSDFKTSRAKHIIKGSVGCPACSTVSRRAGSHSLSTEEFIARSLKRHCGRYRYDRAQYVNGSTKVIVTCVVHGDFYQNAKNHLNGSNCPKCSGHDTGQSDFVRKALEVHGDRYDYDMVSYLRSDAKVVINCRIHGSFEQSPNKHLAGQGCRECKKIAIADHHRLRHADVIERFRTVHGDRYLYDKVSYRGWAENVLITCRDHGDFEQTVGSHMVGSHCPVCFRETVGDAIALSHDEFISRCLSRHGSRYDYSETRYTRNGAKIIIGCREHGKFEQSAGAHASGQGCPSCVAFVSLAETKWLDSFEVPSMIRQKRIWVGQEMFLVDGYDPLSNTVYEFYGDYWHGNPAVFDSEDLHKRLGMTYGELFERTMRREEVLRVAGYSVVAIWESDWKAAVRS